jgi:deazaflavin-dependent oxidoreductase (nitroreductase family)
MSTFSVPQDAPDWIRTHTEQYLNSNGEEGHMWDRPDGSGQIPCLLLVTKGRRSGELRTLPLIYGEADDAYVIVASRGGARRHPSWYLNLVANPDVSIMVGPEQMEATARTADGTERDKLFAQMAQSFAPYLDYAIRAAGADRQIPVVVLDPKRD